MGSEGLLLTVLMSTWCPLGKWEVVLETYNHSIHKALCKGPLLSPLPSLWLPAAFTSGQIHLVWKPWEAGRWAPKLGSFKRAISNTWQHKPHHVDFQLYQGQLAMCRRQAEAHWPWARPRVPPELLSDSFAPCLGPHTLGLLLIPFPKRI